MSRSNPTTKNPAHKFLKWAGSKGELQHYDKEKQVNVSEKLPFTFLVLDELSTITGFNKPEKSNYWSNEVRNVKSEEFIVKTSTGTKATGLYNDLAGVRSKGAKYAKSIYIAYKEGDELVIGNFKAVGAALTAWIDFSKKTNVYKNAIKLVGKKEADDEDVKIKYFIPIFEASTIADETNQKAVELDRELQTYLNQYFSYKAVDNEPTEDTVSTEEPVPEYPVDGIDEVYDMGDEPINLNDIPF